MDVADLLVVLTDIDGTLAPIAQNPQQVAVPDGARAALAELSGRFVVVGCISGRRATEARTASGRSFCSRLDGAASAFTGTRPILAASMPTNVITSDAPTSSSRPVSSARARRRAARRCSCAIQPAPTIPTRMVSTGQLQGNGEWLTGCSSPVPYRPNLNGASSPCGSPSSSLATRAPTPIILNP